MKPQIIEETPLTLVEVSSLLSKLKKRDTELNLRAQKTEGYVNHFAKLKKKEYEEKEKEMHDLNIPRLKPHHVKKIIDVLPKNASQLKMLFQGQVVTISDVNAKKIVEVLAKN